MSYQIAGSIFLKKETKFQFQFKYVVRMSRCQTLGISHPTYKYETMPWCRYSPDIFVSKSDGAPAASRLTFRVAKISKFPIHPSSPWKMNRHNGKCVRRWNGIVTHLSMQIFSTCGTSTCNNRIIVCNGSLTRHDETHSGDGFHIGDETGKFAGVTRMLPRCNVRF